MNAVDLDAIRKRHRVAEVAIDRNATPDYFIHVIVDAAKLITEVVRLRAALAVAELGQRAAEVEAERAERAVAVREKRLAAALLPLRRCGQLSVHPPHTMAHGPDQPRNCPGVPS